MQIQAIEAGRINPPALCDEPLATGQSAKGCSQDIGVGGIQLAVAPACHTIQCGIAGFVTTPLQGLPDFRQAGCAGPTDDALVGFSDPAQRAGNGADGQRSHRGGSGAGDSVDAARVVAGQACDVGVCSNRQRGDLLRACCAVHIEVRIGVAPLAGENVKPPWYRIGVDKRTARLDFEQCPHRASAPPLCAGVVFGSVLHHVMAAPGQACTDGIDAGVEVVARALLDRTEVEALTYRVVDRDTVQQRQSSGSRGIALTGQLGRVDTKDRNIVITRRRGIVCEVLQPLVKLQCGVDGSAARVGDCSARGYGKVG